MTIFNRNSVFWTIYAKIYDFLNYLFPYRKMMEKVADIIHRSKVSNMLDAGCGPGNLELYLNNNIDIEAIDFSSEMLSKASDKSLGKKIFFNKLNLNKKLPFNSDYFDGIVSINTIYSLNFPKYVIKEFYRVLKKGGILIVVNPKKNADLLSILKDHWKNEKNLKIIYILPALLLIGFLNLFIIKKASEKKYNFYDCSELCELLENNGFLKNYIDKIYANQSILAVYYK